MGGGGLGGEARRDVLLVEKGVVWITVAAPELPHGALGGGRSSVRVRRVSGGSICLAAVYILKSLLYSDFNGEYSRALTCENFFRPLAPVLVLAPLVCVWCVCVCVCVCVVCVCVCVCVCVLCVYSQKSSM